MVRIVLRLEHRVKVQVRRIRRSTREAGLATRCQIVLHAAKGRSSRAIAEAVGCHRSWVSRVLTRFRDEGVPGLLDRREDNGQVKVTEDYLGQLYELVSGRPTDHGHRRPTWTRELLRAVMAKRTGIRIALGTMSRALNAIGARRGRPKPVVRCPWGEAAKNKRLGAIRRLLASLPEDEVAVYEDEVDIHLNPKIGLDWMNRGQQKEVVTPGQNEKRYLAGAKNARTGELTVVEGQRKNSALFVAVLAALNEDYPRARRIHVILDNYRIHTSQISQQGLAEFDGRIVLHFLPPYCPDENKIERVWEDLHSEVTRNHNCPTMDKLMDNVRHFIRPRSRRGKIRIHRVAA
jgi:transposase